MNIPPVLVSSQILENKEILPGYFVMKLDSPEIASRVVPGQFFHIRVEERLDIILRRPISVFDFDDRSISILYEVVGKGTYVLSGRKAGEELDILGPLGNGFTSYGNFNNVVLIGGGIGIAPLFCWAKELLNAKKQGRNITIKALIGANNKYRVLCEKDFRKIGVDVEVATDDGSYGYKGFVTDLFRERIAGLNLGDMVVYGCGPHGMLKNLSKILLENNIKGDLSFDKQMGCGMGVCLGCVISTKDGRNKRICKDGPVFRADEILWE